MNKRTCNRCNRPLRARQKKFCSQLCANRTHHAERSARLRERQQPTCRVTGCDKPGRSMTQDVCPMHYHRKYRTGSYEIQPKPPRWADLTGRRYGTLVVTARTSAGHWQCTCDCGATCTRRAGDLNRTGDRNTCNTPGKHLQDDPGYGAAHDRVRRLHGPASQHACTDCGRQAAHWSYNHRDPNPRYAYGLSPHPVAYSSDPKHYEPRCVPCHKRYDLGRAHATPRHAYRLSA